MHYSVCPMAGLGMWLWKMLAVGWEEPVRKEAGRRPRELETLNSQYFDQYVLKPNNYVAFT